MKGKSWLVDAFIGLLLSLYVAASYILGFPLLEGIELRAYDMRSKLRQSLEPSSEIVMIAIDDNSISQLGRWPWPRSRIAGMIDKLAAAGPKVIGLNIVFSEPETAGLAEVNGLWLRYNELVAGKKIVEKGVVFAEEFSATATSLDQDARLLASMKAAGNVVLPMFFAGGGLLGATPDPLPPAISSSVLTYQVTQAAADMSMPDGTKATYPLAALAEAARGVGHVNVYPDFDGVVRREMPAMKYGDSFFPSYALQLVMASRGLSSTEGVFSAGEKIQIGPLAVPVDKGNATLITFNGPDQTFRSYSFTDVMNDKVSMDAFKDKIVLVGPTAVGISTLYVTPVAHNFPSIEMVANVIENILNQKKFLVRPAWALSAELGLIGFTALFIMFLLPRMKALGGAVASTVLLLAYVGAGTVLFQKGEWVKTTYPAFLLAAGYLVITSKRFLSTEKGKELVEASQIETNKMLGLSFQGQGMLDMAFEKFRLCPLDDNMKDTLYNLALDFERKRQYNKALSVFGHIAEKDPKFKDIEEKMKVLKHAAEGGVVRAIGGQSKEGTVMIAGGSTKPTLGRYEIEKELGRGAMGIVYLGRDPKINRMVAIKTMVLEEGSDAASTKEIKERFFREAEAAGTLNHPNIVKIFDAGDEAEISYIAMELLDGHDLVKFASKDGLLPVLTALEYVAIVADALDFAHEKKIVHRDIKPANIMLLKDGSIRVADFGIARITASSKTATGTVMGTPSYMSPEQVAGKKVDGRSDLFSLTVALFEFLTGEKPFKGGEGIGTLLFQIANDPHPDILTIKAGLPACVSPIINKGLAKNPDERYARGSLLAKDLRACIEAVKSGKGGAAVVAAAPAAPAAVAPAPAAVAAASASTATVNLDALAPSRELPEAAKEATLPAVPPPTLETLEGLAGLVAPAPSPSPVAAVPLTMDIPPAAAPALPALDDLLGPRPSPSPAAPAPGAPPAPSLEAPSLAGLFAPPAAEPAAGEPAAAPVATPLADLLPPAPLFEVSPAPAPALLPEPGIPGLELGTRPGVGAKSSPKPPPPDSDATIKLGPGQALPKAPSPSPSPDATVRMPPKEPS